MGKYELDAQKLLSYVGGTKNISAVSHCATRMRFVLNDPKKADVAAIEQLDSVKGVFSNAGQFQVIIGNDVQQFFNDFSKISGISGVSKEESKQAAKQNLNMMQRFVSILAEVFGPLIPAIIVGGLILGFRNILEGIPFSSLDGLTIVEYSQFWNGVNHFLWLIGEAIFHFLPVGITWSIAKRMGTTEILGIVLGITLVSPQLLNAYAVAGTAASEIPFWDFGFAQVPMIGYQAQVIPAMLAGFMLAYLEIFFRKIVPQAVSMIFVPFFSLVPTVLAAHIILGPFGWFIGAKLSEGVSLAINSPLAWLFGLVYGTFYAPLVITGLHHLTLTIDLQMIADLGYTTLWPMVALSNIAQGSAVLAIIFLHRGNKKEEQVSVPSTISAYLGVTEPAMFGINLKYVYPFVAAMIGSGIAGCYVTLMNVKALSVGIGGLPGIISIENGSKLSFLIGMIIVIVVPFLLTILFEKKRIFSKVDPVDEQTGELIIDENGYEEKLVGNQESFYAPARGLLIPITDIKDDVFSKKLMGDGFAVIPNTEDVYAPISGIIESIFPTKHAISIKTDQGLEVLIHMGIDTVELKGEPFDIFVSEGDVVDQSTLLAKMNIEDIKNKGKQTDIVVIITNMDRIQKLKFSDLNKDVIHSDLIGEAIISN